jgi:anti-sigma factor RsiW
MLSERYRELLAAYVDGPASARQRRLVQRLLQRSAEARRLLQRLQSDSHDLIHLPPAKLDRDLSPAVLHKIAARRLAPARRVRRFTAPGVYPVWVGAAVAAAVLFAVGTASYCTFATFLDRPAAPRVAAHNQNNRPLVVPDAKAAEEVRHDIAHTSSPASAETSKPDLAPTPTDDVAHQEPVDPKPAVTPDKEEPVFTSEGMEMFVELKSVVPTLDVPATFKLRDLPQDAIHKKLVEEFEKDSAIRLELPCPDGSRAFERLQAILKTHHAELMIDASAQRRLAKPAWRTNYVLYSEGMTAPELALLLQQIGADKRPGENLFDHLVVRRMTERDHKELSDLLGVDPVQVKPSKETGAQGVDPRKPVSDQTAVQVAAALAGQGKAGAKPTADHTILAMPYNPVRPRRDSAEVKRFLDERKPLRPGALQVLLVLRGPTG